MIRLTKKQIISISLLLALVLLSIIPVTRFITNKPLLSGDAPYYHLRIAEYIKEEGIPTQDPLIKRPYLPQPYHLILALNPALLSLLIPLLSGLISIILFYLVLKQLNIDISSISLILLILILSPLFIFLFSTSNQFSIIILLMLLGFYLFTKEKNYFIPSLLIFAIMPFFGFLPSMISISLILIYTLYNKSKLKYFYTILAAIIIIFTAYQLPFIINYGIAQKTKFIPSNILTNLISDLGSNIGFGIFNILLAAVGISVLWRTKKQIIAYSLLIFIILASFYIPEINIYLTFLVAIFAGYGFLSIIKMKWKIDLIKTLTIILIICGLLFSTLSYANRIANSPPDKETMQGLVWLKENSAEEDVIFSHYQKGAWIQAISNRPVVLDSQINYIPDLNIKFNDTNTTFYSQNLKITKTILFEYNVKYIWIDSEMKQGQVWTREKQGLLFLFRNNETFKKLYDKNNIEVWEFLG